MKTMQSGFTLIELVVVIVILGILAVTAVPRFIDLTQEADAAAVKGVAGSIASAAAINYAGGLAGDGGAQTIAGDSCADAAALLLTDGAPAGYTIGGALGASGSPAACTVTKGGQTATVQVIAF